MLLHVLYQFILSRSVDVLDIPAHQGKAACTAPNSLHCSRLVVYLIYLREASIAASCAVKVRYFNGRLCCCRLCCMSGWFCGKHVLLLSVMQPLGFPQHVCMGAICAGLICLVRRDCIDAVTVLCVGHGGSLCYYSPSCTYPEGTREACHLLCCTPSDRSSEVALQHALVPMYT